MSRMIRLLSTLCALPVFVVAAQARPACDIVSHAEFAPQHKTVILASRPGGASSDALIVFRSGLRVNTDGAPNSYHPFDLKGAAKAINNIANGVAAYKNRKPLGYQDTIRAFEAFRDANWVQPDGYRITWDNVLAARTENQRKIPCIFKQGEHSGYFGSLTALKNGLSGAEAGECDVNNQLDERVMPALVIAGGANPIKAFGAKLGDLLVAVNPANGAAISAVIGDTGPPGNLGEGSVALNMNLLRKTVQPANYAEAKKPDTGATSIIVAIIPASAGYQLVRPYSPENIEARTTAWAAGHGYKDLSGFVDQIEACASGL